MEKNLIKNLIEPLKVIELGGIKIHLRGVNFLKEQYIEAPKVRVLDNVEHAERIGAEIVSRVIRNVVRKVENVVLKIDGKEKPFQLEFDQNDEITLESYTIFMRVLNHCPEAIDHIMKFYDESRVIQGIEIKKK